MYPKNEKNNKKLAKWQKNQAIVFTTILNNVWYIRISQIVNWKKPPQLGNAITTKTSSAKYQISLGREMHFRFFAYMLCCVILTVFPFLLII